MAEPTLAAVRVKRQAGYPQALAWSTTIEGTVTMSSTSQSGGPTASDPKIGMLLLDRYRIRRKLGEGGMGAVYEGEHELIGRRVAIKCLHPQFTSNPEVVERFHREARAATSVGNEHIIEVTDVGTFADGSPFLVMEFLEGRGLSDLLQETPVLPVGRLVHVVLQVCDALEAAHARGIVHRDVKPENIFLVRRGGDADFVKVLDFGISKIRSAEESLAGDGQGGGGLTRTGMAIGTPYYMPPEQARGVRDIDARADVYALGVILYQALAGRVPYDAENYPSLMVKILTEPPVALRQIRADIPEALEAVVHRALAKERDERFASVAELALALEPFMSLEGAPVFSRRPSALAYAGTQAVKWSQAPSSAPAPPQPRASTQPTSTPMSTEHPSEMADEPASTSPAVRGRVAALAVLALGALVVIALVWRRGASEQPPPPAGPVPQAALQPPAPEPPSPPAAPAPPPAAVPASEVRVRVTAAPAEARIFIEDVEFPNPLDARRPRSLDPVHIRIEAKGYQSVEELTVFDEDRVLAFALETGTGTKELREARSGGASQPSPARAETAPPVAPPPEPAPLAKPSSGDAVYRGPTGEIRDEF